MPLTVEDRSKRCRFLVGLYGNSRSAKNWLRLGQDVDRFRSFDYNCRSLRRADPKCTKHPFSKCDLQFSCCRHTGPDADCAPQRAGIGRIVTWACLCQHGSWLSRRRYLCDSVAAISVSDRPADAALPNYSRSYLCSHVDRSPLPVLSGSDGLLFPELDSRSL